MLVKFEDGKKYYYLAPQKIKVGDKIDEIELPDTNGNMFKLSSTKGKKVLLTFYRIAGCSFCNLRLMEFKKKSDESKN